MLKEDAHRQFYRLPYLSDKGKAYYLDLLVLRANARLKGKSIFYTFLKAIIMHVNDPLEDYNPYIPVREEEEEEEVEVDEETDDEDANNVYEDDWFVYPKDLTYEDDSDDADFVP